MSRLVYLYQLQQIDSQIDQQRARLEQIEAALAERDALTRIEQRAAKTEAAADQARKELRQDEARVVEQRIKIEQSESTLYGGKVRNPKELQDLQSEVAALKRYLSTLEDRQLEAMLAVDETESKNQAMQARLSEALKKFEKQQARLQSEKSKSEQALAGLMEKRQAASAAVDSDDLQVYQTLRQRRAGVAVARVKEGVCSACGSTLTAAQNQAARSPSQLTYCDSCGRILYGS